MMLTIIHFFLPFTLLYFLYALFFHPKRIRNVDRKTPPGPAPLPIIGNLHMLGTLPHRTLQCLSKKYGPIMSLKLGQIPAIVVSSPEAAELFLKTHDVVFASHPKIQASELLSYGSKGMAFSEYGPYWRSVRKLCILQLLSASKVETFAPLRREELGLAVKKLEKAAAVGQVVNLSDVVENLIKDVMYKMIFGRNEYSQFGLKTLIQEASRMVGAFNLADYVPWLAKLFDLQGLTRGFKKNSKALDEVMEKMIKEHEQEAANVNKTQDFVDILLSTMHKSMDYSQNEEQNHYNNNVIDRTNIKAILLDMCVGAIETSATLIEWTLSELLRHPRVMKTLQDEIENEVGINRIVEETDLVKLNYLNMVVDETLRLYPVAPLLVPRESRENITIDGYRIEKKSRIIINVWAIGRDPDVWSENAETFYPERFLTMKISYQGDFKFIPFSSGRRGCPGMHLGLVTTKLVIAQLVHCFNWELPFNVSPENLNMEEKFGLSMPRAQQLYAIPIYRLSSDARHECEMKVRCKQLI